MHEESYVCFALRRPVEANSLAEFKPRGTPIDPGELKTNGQCNGDGTCGIRRCFPLKHSNILSYDFLCSETQAC